MSDAFIHSFIHSFLSLAFGSVCVCVCVVGSHGEWSVTSC